MSLIESIAIKKEAPAIRKHRVIAGQKKIVTSPIIYGLHKSWIKFLIWMTISRAAIFKFKNPVLAIKKINELRRLRNQYRREQLPMKYAQAGRKYFVNYNTPAWPSKAFNRYIDHMLNRSLLAAKTTLSTVVFAITKKCGFECEHCCEWENLNRPEKLSKEDLLKIINSFHQLGISQVQLSGGEPLNRFADILWLLDNKPPGLDHWLYTSGYQLTQEKANQLKQHGLTGITISLDHCEEELHDVFRGRKGAFARALQAAGHTTNAGLSLCFSLCATKEFISRQNLMRYASIAKNASASFIQVLEPKAVGHYAGKNVLLEYKHQQMLEDFCQEINYDPHFKEYPIITYHGSYSRRLECSGSGKDYLYIDTDGDIHNCPFCQQKLFSAFDDSLADRVAQMKKNGCTAYICSPLNQIQ